jgi:protein-S-isoprenylcysteine O-methyltransferase Ste14
MTRYVLLIALWAGWCASHSALISRPVVAAVSRLAPGVVPYYRLLFNLTATATLVPLLWYTRSLKSPPMVSWAGPWRILPVLLAVTALYFFAAGARRYDLRQFLGLRQIHETQSCSVLTDDCSLDTGGVLSVVRHPWYTGGILIVWAQPLDLAALLTNLVIVAYFVVGALIEERKLERQFGEQYRAYRQRVSMFFPLKWAVRWWHALTTGQRR